MQQNLDIALDNLHVLTEAFGRTNRNTRFDVVRDIGTNYRPAAVGVLTALRRKSDGLLFLIDGHHRYEGINLYASNNQIKPNQITVRVDVYDESDVPPGQTASDFIDSTRKALHRRASETPSNEIQRIMGASPWKTAFATAGRTPQFSRGLTVKLIIQARLIADEIKRRKAAGNDFVACVTPFPKVPRMPEILRTIEKYNATDATRTVRTLYNWADAFASRSKLDGNFMTLQSLVFAILVDEEPTNVGRRDPVAYLAANMAKAPNTGNADVALRAYIAAANHRIHINKLTILGIQK